jgi:hypothetical protein
MKHRKGSCAQFLESGIPCEDCDLEGHTLLCGWHRDWHRCSCGALEKTSTDWFRCPRCDAGYEDQMCSCEEAK